jgi:hypothetical protein
VLQPVVHMSRCNDPSLPSVSAQAGSGTKNLQSQCAGSHDVQHARRQLLCAQAGSVTRPEHWQHALLCLHPLTCHCTADRASAERAGTIAASLPARHCAAIFRGPCTDSSSNGASGGAAQQRCPLCCVHVQDAWISGDRRSSAVRNVPTLHQESSQMLSCLVRCRVKMYICADYTECATNLL